MNTPAFVARQVANPRGWFGFRPCPVRSVHDRRGTFYSIAAERT
jgi:hypothetical protein